MARVTVSTVLSARVEEVRREVMTSRLLRHVSWPLVVFTPLDPPALPEVWVPGDYRVRMRAFGLLPLGEQTIGIEPPSGDHGETVLRDDGHGQLVRRWDHRIRIRPGPDGRSTLYRDEIDLDAGAVTPVAWAWAQVLYRWRQRRWRRLAASGFAYRDR